jgi:hypothetical protein
MLAMGPGGTLLVEALAAVSQRGVTGTVRGGTVRSGALYAWLPDPGHWVGPLAVEPASGDVVGLSWDVRDPGATPRLVLWLIASSTGAHDAMQLFRATISGLG